MKNWHELFLTSYTPLLVGDKKLCTCMSVFKYVYLCTVYVPLCMCVTMYVYVWECMSVCVYVTWSCLLDVNVQVPPQFYCTSFFSKRRESLAEPSTHQSCYMSNSALLVFAFSVISIPSYVTWVHRTELRCFPAWKSFTGWTVFPVHKKWTSEAWL